MAATIKVRIMNPQEIIWQGIARSVSSKNSAGPFDILPQHANFITIVKENPIIVDSLAGKKKFTFKNAIIYNHNNAVAIYAV